MAVKAFFLKYRPQIVYTLLALLIIAPLLNPGFILTLDMVFAPHIHVPSVTASSYLFYALLHVLNLLIPGQVLEKLLLFIILFLSGYSMYRLASSRHARTTYAALGSYIAGALYMINPFTYDRFMAGQFAVLLGYSLLPFFVRSLLIFLAKPNMLTALLLALWVTLIGIVSIHSIGLVAVMLLIAAGLAAWRYRNRREKLVKLAKFAGQSVVVFVILSSYWLVPLMLGHSSAAQGAAGFTSGDQQAFATLGGNPVGKLANVIRLQGFWAENRGLFTLPQAHMIAWGLIVLGFWALVITGVVADWRHNRRFVTALLLGSASVAILIAMGILDAPFTDSVRLLRGLREPDKFAGLVALAFAFFAGIGSTAILDHLQRQQRLLRQQIVLGLVLLLPILMTPVMFWGFGNQLHSREYPATWANMNTRLSDDKTSFQVLFLPWHLYMYYGFAGRIIASPAPNYFDKPILVSNDPEFKGASPTNPNMMNTQIRNALHIAPAYTKLGGQLATFHVKYILLDKDNDYLHYGYLDHQSDLQLLHQDANFKLYLNRAYKG